MSTEGKLYEHAWRETAPTGAEGALPGLHLEQRRVEGVFVPVGWHGLVNRQGAAPGEALGFLKYFDHQRLRDDFSGSYERAIDQRAVDRTLERERDRLLAEVATARQGLRGACELLDFRSEDHGQRLYAVYRPLDPERRMDRLLARRPEGTLYGLGMLRSLLGVLQDLEASGIVHGRLHEREIYFPDADGERLGEPRLLPFEPGTTESFEHWLELADPETEENPCRHALTRVLPALFLHRNLVAHARESKEREFWYELAEADFERRFPQWYREVRRATDGRRSSRPPAEAAAELPIGVPIRPQGTGAEDVRSHSREKIARRAYAPGGDLRPRPEEDRRAFFRILLRVLGGRLQEVLSKTAREAGPGKDVVEAFDANVRDYLERRSEAFEDFSVFAPWLAGGLSLQTEPPAVRRIGEFLATAIEHTLERELDRQAGRSRETFTTFLEGQRLLLHRAGLDDFSGTLDEALRDVDRDGLVAWVQVRGRMRRYRLLHRAPRGVSLTADLTLCEVRARDAYGLVDKEGRRTLLDDAGEIVLRGNRHPYRIHRSAERRVLELEGFYGERLLFVSSALAPGTPILRLGTRRGRMTFDFRGRREDFEPLLSLCLDPEARPGTAPRYGIVIEERARRVVSDLGLTIQHRPLREYELGVWLPLDRLGEGSAVANFSIDEEDEVA